MKPYKRNDLTSNFRSKFEFDIAKNLTERNVDFSYESKKLAYYVTLRGGFCQKCGHTVVGNMHTYTPDFFIESNEIHIEAKGYLDSTTRTKMKNIKLSNSELDIRMLFLYDNWTTSKKKQRYSDWCEKNGFLYAFKIVPDSWLVTPKPIGGN